MVLGLETWTEVEIETEIWTETEMVVGQAESAHSIPEVVMICRHMVLLLVILILIANQPALVNFINLQNHEAAALPETMV
jgi:hypothetical protein